MKKKAAFTLVACSIAALFLICVLAVGLSQNGFGIFKLAGEASAGWSKAAGDTYEYTWDPVETDVTGLDIDWINGEVEVKVGAGDLIRITERPASGKLEEQKRLKLSTSGDNLRIQWDQGFRLISFGIFVNNRKDLTVELPRSFAGAMGEMLCENTSGRIHVAGLTAKKMSVSSTSGSIKLSDLKLEKGLDIDSTSGEIEAADVTLGETVSVSTTSGTVTLSNVQAKKADLDTVSGALTYLGSAEEFDGSSVSAAIRGEFVNCPEKVDLNAVSGGLTLVLPENDGFETEYSSVSGDFSSDFPVTGGSGKSGRAKYASGAASFQFSTTSGDMKILKRSPQDGSVPKSR